jgi:hypothetical protein
LRHKAPAELGGLVERLRQSEPAPAEFVEKFQQLEREAEAYWGKLSKVSDAHRQAFDERYVLPARGAASAPSKPAPSRPAPTAERGETMTQEVLRCVVDEHYSEGRPRRGSRPMSWRSLALRIKRHWSEACDALGLSSSERPGPPDPRTVSRFFRQRDARG